MVICTIHCQNGIFQFNLWCVYCIVQILYMPAMVLVLPRWLRGWHNADANRRACFDSGILCDKYVCPQAHRCTSIDSLPTQQPTDLQHARSLLLTFLSICTFYEVHYYIIVEHPILMKYVTYVHCTCTSTKPQISYVLRYNTNRISSIRWESSIE